MWAFMDKVETIRLLVALVLLKSISFGEVAAMTRFGRSNLIEETKMSQLLRTSHTGTLEMTNSTEVTAMILCGEIARLLLE